MQELVHPVRHEWLARGHAYGKIAIEPFEPGFALTAGNAYRRVLVSSIAGSAPTWVRIEGVLHEFSHLVGVREDTLDIIVNLQKVVFRLHVNRSKSLHLRVQGARTVTARDFQPDPDVQVLTPNVALATLDTDCSLEMEVRVEQGRGYQPAEKRVPQALPISAMLMDANFSPVKRVIFHVESQPSGYERLVIELWTNGTVTPEIAIGDASRILDDQFALLIDFPVGPQEEAEGTEQGTEPAPRSEVNEHLFRNVDELELSARVSNCLKTANIWTIADLVQKTESELLMTKDFGKKSLNEIRSIVGKMGLSLGMRLDPEDLERVRARDERSFET